MRNKRPFYKNGIVIGLLLFIVGALVTQKSSSAGGMIALVGLLILIITPIKRVISNHRNRNGNANNDSWMQQEQRVADRITEINSELSQKEQELAEIDKLLTDRSRLLAEVKESMKNEAQKQVDREFDYKTRLLQQYKQDLAEAEAQRDSQIKKNTAAERKLDSTIRKNEKYQALAAAMQHAYDLWYTGNERQAVAALKSFGIDELYSEPDLQCMTMKDLRKRYKELRKLIDESCAEYQIKCADEVYKVITQLLVYGTLAELELVLYKLQFGKKDEAVRSVKAICDKYSASIKKANIDFKPPIEGLIGQLEYLFFGIIDTEYEYYVRRERAKEEQKALREQMKQEAEERKQLEQERKKVEAEEKKYQQEMERIRQEMQTAHDAELESLRNRLNEMQSMMDKVEERKADIVNLQNGKAGTIYVISNIGSFGEGVFKVGMTRRLVPEERINELSNASVPFPFDIHSLIFSEDAPALEAALHRELNEKRVNKVNLRKEFFRVSIEELQQLVEQHDPTAPFKVTALAEQYRQSLTITDVPDSVIEEVDDEDIDN